MNNENHPLSYVILAGIAVFLSPIICHLTSPEFYKNVVQNGCYAVAVLGTLLISGRAIASKLRGNKKR